jgi:hypothetical protein
LILVVIRLKQQYHLLTRDRASPILGWRQLADQ